MHQPPVASIPHSQVGELLTCSQPSVNFAQKLVEKFRKNFALNLLRRPLGWSCRIRGRQSQMPVVFVDLTKFRQIL